MKQFTSFLFASVLGAVSVLGIQKLVEEESTQETSTIVQQNNTNKVAKLLTSGPDGPTAPLNFIDAANNSMESVVHIRSLQEYKAQTRREQRIFDLFGAPRPSRSSGSGVIISNKGYIVTNNHVIENSTQVEVILSDKRKVRATVIGTDPSTDLAVLKIQADNIKAIQLGDSDKVQVGEWVLAVGNPFELTSTVTAGIVSAKGRDISILEGQSIESFIQTDAAVNPGNSGGALVNSKGDLIGINTAIATPTGTYAGYSFAVPVNLARKVIQDLIEFGEVKRAYLGIQIIEIDSDFAKEYNLSTTEGVYVEGIVENGGAEKAGIRRGDVITAVNNKNITSVAELQEQIASRNRNVVVAIQVLRQNKYKKFKVRLSE